MNRNDSGNVRTGGCYCGQVRVSFDGAPQNVVHCHCGQCRRLGGGAFTTWASVRHDALTLEGAGHLLAFEATPNITRRFCRHCGTHVYTDDRRLPGIAGIPAGVLAPGAVITPEGHYYFDDRVPWHRVGDELPRHGGDSGFEPLPMP
ncbi:GFA family protein [Schlegelella sp. S2-27]|uniref:GFA family protein n=1 Tax=Caldimonas mangrovi TaxID=2944811 RepID=A0ABT0YTA7_9BURK|nr:GFA family protein [Caldimonas mangrovi]